MSRYRIQDQEGVNFITCAVVGWIDVFTRKKYRDLIIQSLSFSRKEKGLKVYAFIIMSNHIHLILQAGPKSVHDLSAIIRDFKKFTAVNILEMIHSESERRRDWMLHMFKYHAKYNTNNRYHQFWQQDNHPIILYSPQVTWQKINYIHDNPVRAGIVENPIDYLYSSARNYAQLNQGCIMEIDLMEPWWSNAGKL